MRGAGDGGEGDGNRGGAGSCGPRAKGDPLSVSTTPAAFEAVSSRSFDETVSRVRELLAAEGFGIVMEIDMAATLKKKLDVDVPPYLILGACHAPSARKALEAAPEVGVLLPCNVTVSVETGRTVVRAMNPESVLSVVGKPSLRPIGAEVGAGLRRVVTTLASA